jgi:hypothetical protein
MLTEAIVIYITLGISFGLMTFYRIFLPSFKVVNELGIEISLFAKCIFYLGWQVLTIISFPALLPGFLFRDRETTIYLVTQSMVDAFDE